MIITSCNYYLNNGKPINWKIIDFHILIIIFGILSTHWNQVGVNQAWILKKVNH